MFEGDKNADKPLLERGTNAMVMDAGSSLARQVGLTARAGLRGLMSIPAMIGDAMGARSSEAVQGLADAMYLPKPENATERVSQDIAGGMASVGGTYTLGKLMQGATSFTAGLKDFLTMSPRAQVIGAGGASAGAGVARENDVGEGGQLLSALAGGFVAPVAADSSLRLLAAGGRGLRAAAEPFYASGREQTVGNVLQRLAQDPVRARTAMQQADDIIPGSRPTAAQASRDEGLLIAERGLTSAAPRAGAELARRSAEQNQARTILLSGMAGDDAAVQAAKAARSTQANQLYSKSFDEAVTITDDLASLAQRPAFEQAVKRAQAIAAEEGVELGEPLKTMRGLHYVKMGLDDVIDGAVSRADTSIGKAQSRAIIGTRDKLLAIMDDLSPAYRQAREAFRESSKPINQMEELQSIQGKVLNAGTDAATGERIMSPAKFYQAVTRNKDELSKVLTKEQMGTLEAIGKDLDRGALSASAGKAAGSNTMQNLSTAHVIGSMVGGKSSDNAAMRTLLRPVQWLNKLNEQQVQDLLVDAMLDPKLAARLMAKATPQNMETLGEALRGWFTNSVAPTARGAAIGSAATQE